MESLNNFLKFVKMENFINIVFYFILFNKN